MGEKNGNSDKLYFLRLTKSLQMVTVAISGKMLAPWKKVMTKLESISKCRDITLLTKYV